MKINGKRKTPIIAAQSEKKDGPGEDPSTVNKGGTKARASRTTSKKNNGVKSAVLDRISDGILALDAGLNYSYLNERAGELLGCNPSDLIGKSLWKAHPDVERTPFAEACQRALETQSVVMLDGYFPASDRWLEGRVYPSEEGVSVLFSEGTQQKQEENRRREERYRILFDTMQEGFLLAEVVQEDGTPDARLLEVNASMSRFLATSRDELVGNTVREVFQLDEEDSQVLERACHVALGEVDPFFVERYETAAGRWLRAHIFSPRAGQFASLVTDITEQKEAEARLQDISKFPGQNPNPVLRFTPGGEILYANQASKPLLRAWETGSVHTTPLEHIRQRLPSVLEDGSNCEIEVANNQTFYMGLLVPVREEGYINLYLRDITERKQAEETLRAHIHQTNAGITRTDLEGRLIFVNQAFCDMLGYAEADLLGKTIWEISHPDDIARNRTMFESLVKDGESFQIEKRVLRRNGSFVWINVGSSPLRDASGRIQAATSIIVDITRRKRAEESLLESALRTLYLSSLSDAMRSQSDPSKVQIEASRLLGASLRVSRVAYVEIEPDGAGYVRDNYVDNVPGIIGQYQIDSCIPADQMSRFQAGRTVTATDIQKDTRFDEQQKAAHEALTVHAQIVVPFLRNGELIAALCIQQDRPRIWRNEEIALVEETAERLQAEVERVHAERKLHESQERLQTAQKAGNVGIWDWDAATNKTYWSETMWTLHGYQQAREDKVWEQSQHPEDQQRVQDKVATVLASSDTEYRDEYRIIHPDGSIHWIESVARIIRDEAGKPVRMSGVNLDITERRQMENAIRESEERFRALVSQTTAGIAESDMAGRFTFVNPRFCEMLGYSEQELLAKTVFELTYVDDRAENRLLFERMVENGESYQFEKRFIRKDGSLLWTDVSVTTIHDLDGKPKGGVGVILDIEKRKQAEEALRGSEERMRLAIEANRMITWEWDPVLDRITTTGNLPEVYGLTEVNKEAEGFALVWPGDLLAHREKVERVKRHGGEYLSEFRITRPADGRLVWMEERAAALTDEEGKVTRLAGVVTDVTERKRAEQELAEFARQQGALYQLAERLNRTETLEDVFDPALDAILSALQCDRASILLYDNEDVMRFVAWRGLSDSYRQATDGHSPWTPDASDPEPICMENVVLADLGEHLKPVIQKEGIGALAFIPLVSNGKLIGKFMVYFNTPHTFAEAEVELGLTIARQLASTIDRKRVEEGLRLSEHKFSRLFHFAPFAVALQKLPEARFTEVNGEFINLFGYSRDELIGRTSVDIGMQMDPVLRGQTIHEQEQFGYIRDAEFQARTRDGRTIWITVNADLVEINGEKYILSLADDITVRSQAEQALRTSEELYRAIARSIPGGGVYVVDRDFRYRVAEGPVTEAFGLTREMLEGRTVTEVFPDERGIRMEERLRRNFAGEIVQFETQFNDRVYWTQQAPLQDSMGRVIILTLDITERKRAEEAMAADLANMQTLRDLGARLVTEGDLHVIYQEFVRAAITITHADAGTVQLLEEGSNELILLATQGLDQGMIEHFHRVKSGSATSCGIALARRERAFVDFDDPAAQDPEGSLRRHVEAGLLSAQSTPLISRSGKPIGMISTHWREHHRPTDQELRYIDLLARQATDLIERKQAEDALRASEERFREIFETAAVSVWVEDFSEVKAAIDELRRQGVRDFRSYFSENPDFVRRAVEMVRVVDVNNETLDLYGAESKADMMRSLSRTFTRDTEAIFVQELIALAEGHEMLRAETQAQTLDGKPLSVLFSMHLNPRAGDYSRVVVTVTDITARKQAEDELQKSEERFARFMQHLPGLAWLKDVKGRYVYANASAEKAFGLSHENLYGLSDKDIFPAHIAEQFRKNDELALLDEKGIQVVETLEQEDNVLHYSLVSKFPIPGPDGRPALIGGTAFDITERIHMEGALQTAREQAEETASRMQRLQKVTASLSDVLTPQQVLQVIVDQGGPSLGAVTGSVMLLSEDGQSLEIVYSNAKRNLVQPYQSFPISLSVPSADAVRSGQPVWLESRQQYLERYPHLADQIEQWGQEAALAIPMVHKGDTLGVLTLSFDHVLPHSPEDQDYILTFARQGAQALGRARAEEALRDSEERYRAIISQATAGIVRKDPAGRLIFVNQAFCNMLDMTKMELLGRTMWELTHEEDRAENKRLYNRLMAEGIPFQLEKRLIRLDGSTLWVNVSVSPVMGESGRPQSAVSVYANITRRKQAENRLTLLARVSELTRQFEEPDDLLFAVSREVGGHFQVRRALFNEIDVEDDREVVHRDYCREVDSVAGVHKLTDYSSITTEEMKTGKTIVNYDSKTDPRTAQDYERSYVEQGERSYVAVPLMHDDQWVASLWISDDKPRQWDKDDVYLLEAIAERTWTAAEKMRVDRALRASEERLRVTFDTTAVGFALLTPDTHFVDVNDALCQIVDYTREELVTMTLDTLVHPDFTRSMHDHIARLLDGRVPSFSIEKLFIRGDGAEIWVQNSVSLVRDADGSPLHLIAICQDITERKREEEALRARTEEIETLMKVSPIGIFVANDPECRFISGNPAGYELLEMPHNPSMNISKSAPPQEQPGYRVFRDGVEVAAENMPMQSAARYGIELREEALELRFENGTRKYIYAFAKPLFDANGRSRGAIAVMLDITERKRVEEELQHLNLRLEERVSNRTAELQAAYEFLRESEATSRLILESMPDAIVITDRDGRIVHANTQVETLFGYTPNEVLGKPVEILLLDRLRNQHAVNMDTFTDQRVRRIMGLGLDLFGLRKDGSKFPVDVMLSPISNNTSWDVMVAIRDNTKQREAQEALRINEEKLRTLFEILPVGISFLGKDGHIVDMNPALTEILGMSKESLLNGSYKFRRYIRSDGMPMSPNEFATRRAITEQKTVYNVETGIVRENGEIKWTSVNAAPVQVADVEVVVATIDITERKQAEEAINRHRESLKLLSRRLVEVQEDERRAIARELHDRVGQNLAALTLNLNILRSQLTPEILDKIGTRLNDSVTLVKDVLAITRSVMADLRPNVLDDYGLDAALNEYADRFSQRYGIRVVNNMPTTPTPRLDQGIEMTLLRIAQEALTNIARHAQASQASMTLELEDNMAHMVIEDNGIGILSWQKVNQAGSHGIRIMRERAEAFGGGLKVHSAYKNGTTIEVRIPIGGGAPKNRTTQEKRS